MQVRLKKKRNQGTRNISSHSPASGEERALSLWRGHHGAASPNTARALNFLGVTALLLAGCMVGPDYRRPSVPMTAAYKEDQGGSSRDRATMSPAAIGGRSSAIRS